MQTVLLVLSGIVTAYIFVLIFRVLLSWFSGPIGSGLGGFQTVLHAITEPWLRLFRRIRFFRTGAIDFSPIVAILVLQVISLLLNYLAITQTFSIITVLVAIALTVWRTLFWIFLFFGIIVMVRIITILFVRRAPVQMTSVLDSLIEPFSSLITRIVPGGRDMTYLPILVILVVLITGICLSGTLLLEPLLLRLLLS